MEWLKKYWKPKSLAFWGSSILIISGMLEVTGSAIPMASEILRPLIDAYTGSVGPIIKIGLGMTGLGIRRRLPDGN